MRRNGSVMQSRVVPECALSYFDYIRERADRPVAVLLRELWWPRPESNQRHTDFQSAALPTELLGRTGAPGVGVRKRSADYKGNSPARQEYPEVAAVPRFTDSKVNESKAPATKRWRRIARRCAVWCVESRAGPRGPARTQQLRAN